MNIAEKIDVLVLKKIRIFIFVIKRFFKILKINDI